MDSGVKLMTPDFASPTFFNSRYTDDNFFHNYNYNYNCNYNYNHIHHHNS